MEQLERLEIEGGGRWEDEYLDNFGDSPEDWLPDEIDYLMGKLGL